MANPLLNGPWEPCMVEPRHDGALETYARGKMGVPHPAIRYFADCPWLARAVVDLHPSKLAGPAVGRRRFIGSRRTRMPPS
jgi:hypothetical protein